MMSVYVVEITGRGVAAFNESTIDAVRVFVDDDGFRDDLMGEVSDGKPLWDGKTELFVRDAFPEEQARWEAAVAEDEEFDADEDTSVFFSCQRTMTPDEAGAPAFWHPNWHRTCRIGRFFPVPFDL